MNKQNEMIEQGSIIVQDERKYEVVEKGNKEFMRIFEAAWDEIGITPEWHDNSEWMIVKNDEGKVVATFEMVEYKSEDEAEVEDIFSFAPWESEDVQLFYVDKLCIDQTERGVVKNMQLLLESLIDYTLRHSDGRKQKIVALIRKRFFRYLNRMLKGTMEQIHEEIDGEIPTLIDFEKNQNVLAKGDWFKWKH